MDSIKKIITCVGIEPYLKMFGNFLRVTWSILKLFNIGIVPIISIYCDCFQNYCFTIEFYYIINTTSNHIGEFVIQNL